MTNVVLRNIVILATGAFIVGCSGNIPQAEKTYTAALSAKEEARLRSKGVFLSDAESRKLDEIERRKLAKAIDLRVLGSASQPQTPLAGFGFTAGTQNSFVIYRDGSLHVFTPVGEETQFEAVAGRLDRAFEDSGRIVAASPRGTMLVLEKSDLSQQTVLRPQTSTFHQVRLFDVATVPGTPYLAAAAEGRRLEIWDMTSGELVEAAEFETVQPRSLLQGCPMDEMVFGTNEGQVRQWSKGGGSKVLYSHDGPVLDVAEDTKHHLLISAAKDGTVIFYDREKGSIVKRIEFDAAVYKVHVSPDQRYAVVVPSLGKPYRIDLDSLDETSLALKSGNSITKGRFLHDGAWFIAQQGGNGLYIWDMRSGASIADIKREHSGGILDFAVSDRLGLLVLATPDNKISYWDMNKRGYVSSPIQVDEDILGVALNDRGDRAIAALANGQMLSWKVHDGVTKSLVLSKDDFSG